MPTGMRVTDPKLVRGNRKFKKVKRCTTLNLKQKDKKELMEQNWKKQWKRKKKPQERKCRKMHQTWFGGALKAIVTEK